MLAYVIVDMERKDRHGLGQTVLDMHLSRHAADAQLAEALADDPAWVERLRVIQIDLDGERPAS